MATVIKADRLLPRVFWISMTMLWTAGSAVGVYRACARSSDFPGFHAAARSLLTTGQYAAGQERYFPTFQLVLLPLGAMPLPVAAMIWGLANLTCLLCLPTLLAKLTDVPPRKQAVAWLCVLPFVWDNLVLGQSGPLLLVLTGAGLLLARGRHALKGGAMIALAAALKVMPAIFIAVPCVLRRARLSGLAFTAGLLGLFAGTFALAGWSEPIRRVREWSGYVCHEGSANGLIENGRSLRYNNQGLAVTIARTFCPVPPGSASGSVHLAHWDQAVGRWMYWAILAALAASWGASCWHARSLPAEQAWPGLFALTGLMMLFISPLVWTHYFIWWLPALVFLAHRPRFLLAIGGLSVLALASPAARGFGAHMWLSVVVFLAVAHDLWRVPGPETRPVLSFPRALAYHARHE